MIKFIKWIFEDRSPRIVGELEIESSSSKELVKILQDGNVSVQSGNRIVAEILYRLVEK